MNLFFLIIGKGEDKKKILETSEKLNISDRVFMINHTENVHFYMKKAQALVLPSLWEDPGFVLVEAASKFIPIISSDCKSGPKEISNNGKNMFIYKTNNKKDFLKTYKEFLKIKNKDLEKKCVNLNKYIRKFSVDFHLESLIKLVQKYSNEKN